MKRIHSSFLLGTALALISVGIYAVQIMIFKTPGNTLFYFFQDIAFLPVQVLIVTLLLNRLLSDREKKEKLKKMNMVISAFFTETGTKMIKEFSGFHKEFLDFSTSLQVKSEWPNKQFLFAIRAIQAEKIEMDCTPSQLNSVRDFLVQHSNFLLSLLENSNLLEHDTFSDMLWAVFHVMDELKNRDEFSALPTADLQHLANDIRRAYALLVIEWVYYMRHLKSEYPYLFSLALRKSPFSTHSSVVITT